LLPITRWQLRRLQPWWPLHLLLLVLQAVVSPELAPELALMLEMVLEMVLVLVLEEVLMERRPPSAASLEQVR